MQGLCFFSRSVPCRSDNCTFPIRPSQWGNVPTAVQLAAIDLFIAAFLLFLRVFDSEGSRNLYTAIRALVASTPNLAYRLFTAVVGMAAGRQAIFNTYPVVTARSIVCAKLKFENMHTPTRLATSTFWLSLLNFAANTLMFTITPTVSTPFISAIIGYDATWSQRKFKDYVVRENTATGKLAGCPIVHLADSADYFAFAVLLNAISPRARDPLGAAVALEKERMKPSRGGTREIDLR